MPDGVIDLIAKGNASRSKSAPSTSVPTASLPSERSFSTPLVAGTSTNSVPGVDAIAIGPKPIARSPSKLAHILLPQLASESEEEEGSEGDELPTFHRGSAKSRAKMATRATISRPAPQPFPIQLTSESPVSPCASRLKERKESWHDDDGDVVEIVDVFTTPRGPSPPRSPTLSPSPVKPLPVHASAGPAMFVKSKQSGGFSISPTNSTSQTSTEPHKRGKPRRRMSPDRDTHVSENERSGTPKSPRKSAAHSSPRHIPRARGRASSPTPPVLSNSSRANDAVLGTGAEGYRALDCRRPQPGEPGLGRKPRPSDTSAIYISSGSEDEDNAAFGGRSGGEAEVSNNQDEWTDRDVDEWADTGMILSAPPSPSPALPSPTNDLVPSVPAVEIFPNPARASKFKPAPATASKVTACAPLAEFLPSTSLKAMSHDEKTVPPRAVLVARARRNKKGRDDDVIDLTSD